MRKRESGTLFNNLIETVSVCYLGGIILRKERQFISSRRVTGVFITGGRADMKKALFVLVKRDIEF